MVKTKRGKNTQGYVYFEKSSQLYVGRFTYTDEYKKRRSVRVSAPTQKEAQLLLQAKIEEHQKSEAGKRESNPRFAVVIDDYIAKRLTPAVFRDGKKVAGRKSIKPELTVLSMIKKHFANHRIQDIRARDLEHFKTTRLAAKSWGGRPRKASTVRMEIEVLKRVFRFALRFEYITKNPYNHAGREASISTQQVRHRYEFPTFAEELALLRHLEHRRSLLKHFLIIAADTGLRSNEILTLDWETDIDFERRRIAVKDENAKTNRARSIAMTERVYQSLQELHAKRGRNRTLFGKVKCYYWFFRKVRRELKLDHLHIHDYRRAFTSRCLRIGVPYAVVVKVTGHLSNEWQKYLNLEQDLFGCYDGIPAEEVKAFGLNVLRGIEAAIHSDKMESLFAYTQEIHEKAISG